MIPEAMMAREPVEKAVIVTTKHRGVFFGYATDTDGDRIRLKRARMAIYWATHRGLLELAEVGPNAKSRISARADIDLRDITSVVDVTEEAVKAWEECK